MRVAFGLLVLLLGLCGSRAQGESGGLGEEGESSELQEEWTQQTTNTTSPDILLEMKELRRMVQMLQKHDSEMERRLNSSERELLDSKKRIDKLENLNKANTKVAFYTALTDAGYVGPFTTDTTLNFSKVFTNIGNAYNAGFFKAPVKGVYYFQFTVCGHHTGLMGVYVYKNNKNIMFNVEWKEDQLYKYFTNSVILELMAGDEIHLALPATHVLYDDGSNQSTFSGALLFPL
ncbi:complement C1q-like protein 4 [Notothenia coriiceps]|uniref:Complement C1q-like protein 4 n=1 Tax=Notothenia coriiceps TaxID=8208 RepID=A0A6I9NNU6_9TELE|nr:PREDICTED: complement C1q-like protein 4 [Notothenia coriiceps]